MDISEKTETEIFFFSCFSENIVYILYTNMSMLHVGCTKWMIDIFLEFNLQQDGSKQFHFMWTLPMYYLTLESINIVVMIYTAQSDTSMWTLHIHYEVV